MSQAESIIVQTLLTPAASLTDAGLPGIGNIYVAQANSMGVRQLCEAVGQLALEEGMSADPLKIRYEKIFGECRKSVVNFLAPGTKPEERPDAVTVATKLSTLSKESLLALVDICICDPTKQEQIKRDLQNFTRKEQALEELAKFLLNSIENPNVVLEVLRVLAKDASMGKEDSDRAFALLGDGILFISELRSSFAERMLARNLKGKRRGFVLEQQRTEIPALVPLEAKHDFGFAESHGLEPIVDPATKERFARYEALLAANEGRPEDSVKARQMTEAIHHIRHRIQVRGVALKQAELAHNYVDADSIRADIRNQAWLERMYEQALARIVGDFEARTAA